MARAVTVHRRGIEARDAAASASRLSPLECAMDCHRRCRVAGIVLGLILSIAPRAAWGATVSQIQSAIEKAKHALYGYQRDETWERPQNDVHGDQVTGQTALAVYALLSSGESHRDPRIARAIAYLKKTPTTGVYALGLRCNVWLLLPPTPDVRAAMARDANVLSGSIIRTAGPGRGFYNYNPGGKVYSHSRAQYAVLGMSAAAQSGIAVPAAYWQMVESAWIADQDSSGGWSYEARPRADHPLTPGMTAAGVTTLFITQEFLHPGDDLACRGNVRNPPIEKGLDWLAANFDKVATDRRSVRDYPYSTLYAVERIGIASGYKYFKGINWYQKGAGWLLAQQAKDGSFKASAREFTGIPHASTCFALLFLSRGSNPIVMNKLDYSAAVTPPPAPQSAPALPARRRPDPAPPWNQRPRDAANVTRWIGRQIERELNWQIVNLAAPARELSDAPILYLCGNHPLHFSDEQAQKVKQYVENGGIVLASADCASTAFSDSFRELGQRMFPAYSFAPLPQNHPIYTAEQFRASRWKRRPTVLSLGNGAREFLLLLPDADAARAWQSRSAGSAQAAWELAADVYLYAVDKQGLRRRGQTHLVTLDARVKPKQTIRLARIEYDGNWDPEPAGWRRLTALLNNEEKVRLVVEAVRAGNDLAGYAVAHLTGTGAFAFDAPARAALTRFVEGGGTIIVDAAGGAGGFAAAAEAELRAIFPQGAASLSEPIPIQHPLFSGAAISMPDIQYRSFARGRLGNLNRPQLRGIEVNGRLAVIFSREDLSVGLVGQPVDGIIGYSPETATRLMSRLVTFAANAAPPHESNRQ
jgi:hypothetical protein